MAGKMDRRGVVRGFSLDSVASSGDAGRCLPRAAGACLLASALLVFLGGGCGVSALRPLKNEAEFREEVAQAKQPLMVEFVKGGCPTCGLLDSGLARLSQEYSGRVVFVRFEILTSWLAVTSPALQKQYRIGMYPTVVLLVNGEEKHRWALEYDLAKYRKVLNEIVGAPAAEKDPVESIKPPVADAPPVKNEASSDADTVPVEREASPGTP